MTRFFFLLFVLAGVNITYLPGQALPRKRTVIVHQGNSIEQLQVQLTPSPQFKTRPEFIYHYFIRDSVFSNRGGFTGVLLEGNYEQHTLEGRLLCRGTFKNGLKSFTWMYWTTNGELIRIEKWKNGQLHGPTSIYQSGKVSQTFRYRHNKIQRWPCWRFKRRLSSPPSNQ